MCARRDGAELLERPRQVLVLIGLAPLGKGEHHHEPRFRKAIYVAFLNQIAIPPGNGWRSLHHVVGGERLRPCQFLLDAAPAVIMWPMDAQDRTEAVVGFNQISR